MFECIFIELKHCVSLCFLNLVIDFVFKVDTWPGYTDEDRETIKK